MYFNTDRSGNGCPVPIGMRFNLEELNYIVIEKTEIEGQYLLGALKFPSTIVNFTVPPPFHTGVTFTPPTPFNAITFTL